MAAQEYCKRDPERDAFYRIFYQTCRRFRVTWSAASPEARAFVEEATRVAYEQDKARRNGTPLESVSRSLGSLRADADNLTTI